MLSRFLLTGNAALKGGVPARVNHASAPRIAAITTYFAAISRKERSCSLSGALSVLSGTASRSVNGWRKYRSAPYIQRPMSSKSASSWNSRTTVVRNSYSMPDDFRSAMLSSMGARSMEGRPTVCAYFAREFFTSIAT